MTLQTRTYALGGAIAALLALTLAGCAGSPDTGPGAPSAPASVAVAGEHNDADVQFAQLMIVHHRDAVEMAELAATRTPTPAVLELADQVIAAQTPEIDLMTGWLVAWGAELPAEAQDMNPMGPGGAMPGALSAEQMADLEQSPDEAFDAAFLTLMIGHHEGAIDMAEDELRSGAAPEALALAESVIQTQSVEIELMRSMLEP